MAGLASAAGESGAGFSELGRNPFRQGIGTRMLPINSSALAALQRIY